MSFSKCVKKKLKITGVQTKVKHNKRDNQKETFYSVIHGGEKSLHN
jgi:hypothetical protein